MATSNAYAYPDGRVRQPVPTSGPTLIFDLYREIRRLQSEQPWQAEHTANTIVKYPDLRIVLVALKAGGRLHEHKTAGRISIQTLSGLLKIHTPNRVIEMSAGTLAALDHELVHDVVAEADSVFLLTIAWPEGRRVDTEQEQWNLASGEDQCSQRSRAERHPNRLYSPTTGTGLGPNACTNLPVQ